MEEIKKILAYNKQFVEEKRYEQYSASKFPNKKLAIVTCMDTRLVELLPAALGLKNGRRMPTIFRYPFSDESPPD